MGARPHFTIGQLSQRSGVKIETVRYYEKIGLLPPPPRTEGGHRAYTGDHVGRLTFIRRSRELGFSLNAIRQLLELVDGGYGCGEFREIAKAQLKDIRAKIDDLQRMEETLDCTVAQCEGGNEPHCPVVDVLSEDVRMI